LPDPRIQIRGIPIWIYLREGTVAANRQYLSAFPAANGIGRVALSSDPNHIRTRWVLEEIPGLNSRTPGSWLGYGHRLRSMFTGNDAGFIASPPRIVPSDRISEFVAITPTFERNRNDYTNPMDISLTSTSDRYRITFRLQNRTADGRTSWGTSGDLRAAGFDRNDVIISTLSIVGRGNTQQPSHDDHFGHWGISPVETFDLIDIRYDFLPCSNSFTATPITIRRLQIANETNSPIQRTVSMLETVTNESSFSRTERITTNINVNAAVGLRIPLIADGRVNTTVSHGSEWSFTNGGRETRTRTITVTDVIQIPARTTVTAELVAIRYSMSITYIATLRGRTTGRVIRLAGTWESVMVQEESTRYFYPDGRIILGSELQQHSIQIAEH